MICNNYSDLFVKKLSFWNKLTDLQKDLLCRNSAVVKYEKGTSLHRGNDNCVGVILIKNGSLRTYMLSEDGREITLYRLYDGDFCILSASCVLDAITFDVFIDVEEDSEIIIINSSAFHKLKDENIYVEAFAYKLATSRFSDVMWAMQQILFMRADQRLAIFLWDEISKSGSEQINMTHDQIAKYMGSAREVISRMLKYFAAEGVVEVFRGGIKVIDKPKLRSFI